MKLYGLIGYPLSHSFSPGYFNDKFLKEKIDASHKAFPLKAITELPDLIAAYPNLCGLNVTIPYKEQVLPYLDNLTDAAKAIGAVNCIQFLDGKLIGHNTDAPGFWAAIHPLLKPYHRNALVLGTGGASKAVVYALSQAGISVTNVSRIASANTLTYEEIDAAIFAQHLLIINTTPIGMSPHIDAYPPLPYHLLTNNHLLYDLVYNPAETLFLKKGKEHGAQVANGYDMLINQADASWDIWTAWP